MSIKLTIIVALACLQAHSFVMIYWLRDDVNLLRKRLDKFYE